MHPFLVKEIPVDASMLDYNGHVNNIVFVKWMQDVAVEHATRAGCTSEIYQRLGVSWVARSHHIDYLNSALPDDVVIVTTWIAGARKVSCRRKYVFTRKSDVMDVLAKAETEWVFVDHSTGRPRKILPEIIDCFTLLGENPELPNEA